jgi:L-methionine (R)-S-oxide reductase
LGHFCCKILETIDGLSAISEGFDLFCKITEFNYQAKAKIMENFERVKGAKEQQYEHILAQASALFAAESYTIANMANCCALLKTQFDWLWIGFYLASDKDNQLVLGPFQGPLACTRIPYDKGVCGTAWAAAKTLVVADVNQFPGHIACSSLSQSEIVVPCFDSNNKVAAVLDIDSEALAAFDEVDQQYLEQLVALIAF